MPELLLQRQRAEHGQPTLGAFYLVDAPPIMRALFVRSLELPWRDNKPKTSCIPVGRYKMRWSMSARFKKMMWEVLKVPGRAGIRIHSGNYAGDKLSDSLGCILPCLKWADINADGVIDGTGSKNALSMLEDELRPFEKTGIDLVIKSGG